MVEREEQEVEDPYQRIYEAVQIYSDTIDHQSAFNNACERFSARTRPSVLIYLYDGVYCAIRVIRTLKVLADPEQKELLLKEMDEEGIPDPWIERTVLRSGICNPTDEEGVICESSDPFALNVLAEVRDTYAGYITKSIKAGTDPYEAEKLEFRANVLRAGADLIINKYRKELERFGLLSTEETHEEESSTQQ